MSAGIPASATGTSLFSSLPGTAVSNSPTSVTGLLQQQLSANVPVSNSTPAYSFGYPPPPPNSFLGNPYFAAAAAAATQNSTTFTNFLNPDREKQQHQRIKLKRTRQRVDAGEPRNTYSSFIPAYQKAPTVPFSGSVSAGLISRPGVVESTKQTPVDKSESTGETFQSHSNHSIVHGLLGRMHFDQAAPESNAFQSINGDKQNDFGDEWPKETADCNGDDADGAVVNGDSEKERRSRESASSNDEMDTEIQMEQSPTRKRHRSNDDDWDSSPERENGKKLDSTASTPLPMNGTEVTSNRSKRKQCQPQQLDVKSAGHDARPNENEEEEQGTDPLLLSMTSTEFDQSEDDESEERKRSPIAENGRDEEDGDRGNEENELESGEEVVDGEDGEGEGESMVDDGDQPEVHRIKRMQSDLMLMQQRYIEALAASQQQQQKHRRTSDENETDGEKCEESGNSAPVPNENNRETIEKATVPIAKEIKTISEAVKSDLYSSVCKIVDDWMEKMQKFVQIETARLSAAQMASQQMQAAQLAARQMTPAWPPESANTRVTTSAAPASNSNVTSTATGGPAAPVSTVVSPATAPPPTSVNTTNAPRPPFFFNPFYYNSFPYASAGLNFAAAAAAAAAASGQQQPPTPGFMSPPTAGPTGGAPGSTIFPSFPVGGPNPSAQSPYMGLNLSQKTGSGTFGKTGLDNDSRSTPSNSLPMPRKKRSKVTDTRVTKLNFRGDDLGQMHAGTPTGGMGGFFPAGAYPPTLLPPHMLNPHHQSPFGGATAGLGTGAGRSSNFDDSDLGAVSPDNSDCGGSEMMPYDPSMPQSVTLTPMHLRKAKLMFFYTRYPSSQLLKAYFPDIRFNKNNTAQLVKWFSNFREFYYIQMEKYARQALAEGVRTASEIHVSCESELYKVLNLHYNRNNHIQVPANFRTVVESTLKEFFLAVQGNRDVEPSWKKAIYKVIARLDDPIPEYFKSPNFLEQLE